MNYCNKFGEVDWEGLTRSNTLVPDASTIAVSLIIFMGSKVEFFDLVEISLGITDLLVDRAKREVEAWRQKRDISNVGRVLAILLPSKQAG